MGPCQRGALGWGLGAASLKGEIKLIPEVVGQRAFVVEGKRDLIGVIQ